MTHPSEPKDWEWIEDLQEDVADRWNKRIWKDEDITKLLTAIREMKFVIEEIHDQSIAHADDSLSSKWLEHLTSEALARLAKGFNE